MRDSCEPGGPGCGAPDDAVVATSPLKTMTMTMKRTTTMRSCWCVTAARGLAIGPRGACARCVIGPSSTQDRDRLGVFFMFVEIFGGYISGSLVMLSDAFHLA